MLTSPRRHFGFIVPIAFAAVAAFSACRGRPDSAATQETASGTAGADSTWTARAPMGDTAARAGFPSDTAMAPAGPASPAARPPAATPPTTTPGTVTRTPGGAPVSRTARPPVGGTTPGTAPAAGANVGSTATDDTAGRDPSAAPRPASPEPVTPAQPAAPAPLPARAFAVGERLTYDVRFGPIRVGQASMEVVGIEPLRGRDAYHTRFVVRGGTAFFRVNDRYESWFDARTMESLRYAQQIDQGSYERERLFEMFPERRTFTEAGRGGEQPSVADPLDDGSFLYFLRTIPLEVGKTYEFNRYFRPDRNPVRVTVLRREPVRVPAGTFNAIVVRPTIKTTGIFSEGGRAEVWFADDSTRRMLQMKSRLSFGTLNLYLRSVQP